MVDFEWYRSFIAIFKHNSVSEAAKTRIMTQPALSHHLASLEAEVGELLFQRSARKLIPTERGKQLYSLLAPLIESLEEETMCLKLNSSPTMEMIRIGTSPEMFTDKIMPHLSRMEWDTITYFGDADRLLDFLKDDRVDIILTSKRSLAPGIEYVRFMEESFVIVAPVETVVPPVEGLKDMEQWLSQQRWISYGLELPVIRRFWRAYFKTRPLIKPVHVIPSLHLILRAVSQGAGMSLLPTYLLKHHNMSETKWKIIFEDMIVHNELLIGFKSKNKHVLDINQFIMSIAEDNK